MPSYRDELPFVGRDAELEALLAALAAAATPDERARLQWVGMYGPPGIGKTRLANELADRACERGFHVLWGRSQDVEGAPPYWPWSRILAADARSRPTDRLSRLLGEQAGTLLSTRGEGPAAPSRDARYRVFAAVAQFLHQASREQPLLLVFEDLHWADASSLQLIRFVATDLVDSPIVLCCTYRSGADQGAAKEAFHEALCHSGTPLALGALSRGAVAELLAAVLGHAPSEGLLDAVYDAAAGNPLFTLEVVRLLRTHPHATVGGDDLPPSLPADVGGVVMRRLDGLDPALADILRLAAVAGHRVTARVLVEATGQPREAVGAALSEGAAAGLLAAPQPGSEGYAFAHALVRDALYQALPGPERARAHVAVAQALERLHADHLGPQAATIAHHYLAAAIFHDPAPAVAFATRAAHYALSHRAYAAAAAHFERALQVLPQLPEFDARRAELMLALGDAHGRGGDADRAQEVLWRAVHLARETGRHALAAEACLTLGDVLDETGAVDRAFVALLTEILALLPDGAAAQRAMVLGRLAQAVYFGADRERAHALAAQAVALAEGSGDAEALGRTLMYQHFVWWEPGRAAARLALVDRVMGLDVSRLTELTACEWALVDLLELGDIDRFDDALDRFETLVAAAPMPRFEWHLTLVNATLATLSGELSRAEELASQAARFEHGGGLMNVEPFYLIQLFEVRRYQGRLADFAPVLSTKAAALRTFPGWRAALALVHAAVGNLADGRVELDALAARDFAGIPRDGQWMACMALLADVCHLLGDAGRAETLYGLLAPYAGQVVVVATLAGCFGPSDHFLALLADTCGRPEAQAHFEAALTMNARLGARGHLARTQLEYVRHLHGRVDPEARRFARRLRREAEATARHLKMDALAALLDGLDDGTAPEPAADPQSGRFVRAADVWCVTYAGQETHLKDLKGAAYLAVLLASPGQEVHVLDLTGSAVAAGEEGLEVLDATARADYRARLGDLRARLADAEANHDLGRVERLSTELDFVTHELAAAMGLGGRSRRTGSAAERARVNVTRAIRRVIRKLAESQVGLGHHLATHIVTGTFCSYQPDPEHPMVWET